MKTFRIISLALPIVLALAACSKEELPAEGTIPGGDSDKIRIAATVGDFTVEDGAPGTRATINDDTGKGSFENGDVIGLSVKWMKENTTAEPLQSLTYSNGSWSGCTTTWDNYAEISQEKPLRFTACYPYRKGTVNYTVQTDQSQSGNYEESDLLFAMKEYAAKPQDGIIELNFVHKMACLKITLQGKAAADASVVIKAVNIGYTMRPDGDGIDTGHVVGYITPKRVGNTFYAVIPPQDLGIGLQLAITVNGKTTEHIVKGTQGKELESGVQYPIELTLNEGSGSGDPPYSTYLAGWYINNTYDQFAYTLVNGAYTALTPPSGGVSATPNAMAVSGGKTYVVGGYFDGNDGNAKACYWVDGAATKLEVSEQEYIYHYAESILVSDGSIYIAGRYSGGPKNIPCYWVDGALTTLTLPDGVYSSAAKSIAVRDDGKIYVAGYHMNGSGGMRTPGYWLDDTFVSLPLPDGAVFQISEAMKIAVSDNKVYVMGTYKLNSQTYSCVWTDGTRSELAIAGSATLGAVGQSMTVAGGKVYVSGYSIPSNNNFKGCYWIDGICTDLNAPDGSWSQGTSIGVINGKVYVGGTHYTGFDNYKPCYWFDGARTDLDIPTGGTSAMIEAIYLSE
ncbi:fimbrillin family protein [Bacteroides thetaiotaomicron]|uniref:fimbrillin family protein n=1 Tax=Bacteroides thetaiotaomicron TaxID=818 RepID=UPI002166389C|nr:fimbrillin family protein [Bacteroides thetaiotaomicron]MCS2450739.1 fimbrillin family protein [Bacteroides thetaiotaomicron]